MPVFQYKAKSEDARSVTGELTARDADEAIEMVSRLGLLPVSVQEKGASGADGVPLRKVKPQFVYTFTRQLASLLKSGVPLLRALEVLGRQTRQSAFAAIITDIAGNLRNGRAFSACLQEYPQAFPGLYVALVRAGEESGRIKELLASLTVYYRKQEEISRKVRGALTYPAFMLFVGAGTVLFILSFVMPKLAVLFDGMKAELPWPTKVVMGLSHGVQSAWPVLFVLFFLGLLAARFVDRSPLL